MSTLHDHQRLRDLAVDIFQATGVPSQDAQTVADMLVDAEVMGLSSHGLQRIPQYVDEIRQGMVKPGAEVIVDRRSPTTAIVDGQWNLGQVVAKRAAEEAIAMAGESGTGSAVVRGCRHVGRLGGYTELCAANECIGLATASGGNSGHWVAPFGGREGRLATNPICFAAPMPEGSIVMDFSTSSMPEGKVRFIRDCGETLPDGILVDASGKRTRDPWALYDPDTGEAAGAILPFGGEQGYKGYGLGFMAQLLSASLGAPVWVSEDMQRNTNGMWILAIRVDAYMDTGAFCEDVQAMARYFKSSSPSEGSSGVMLPGEIESETRAERCKNGVPIHENIWQSIVNVADSLGVDVHAIENG